ncbi:hypothetical protein F5877DRAFT_72464 [Lentinula edodes]|nr:hypothetical protein F5877DRAFT_72464 [Lentinula edodes]
MSYEQFWRKHFDNVDGQNPSISPSASRLCGQTSTEHPHTVSSAEEFDKAYHPPKSPPPLSPGPHLPSLQDLINSSRNEYKTTLPETHSRDPLVTLARSDSNAPAATASWPTSDSPGKENQIAKRPTPGLTVWKGPELIMLARAMVDFKPWLAPYGQKGKLWEDIRAAMIHEGFKHVKMSANSIQKKGEDLVKYWQDPKCSKPGVHSIANALPKGSSQEITIAALMERVQAGYDDAKNKSEMAKAETKKKEQEDFEGGEAIRNASMQAMCSHKALPNSDSDSDSDSNADTEVNTNIDTTKKHKLSSSSSSLLDEDSEPKKKRKRTSSRRISTFETNVLTFLQNDAVERKAHQEELLGLIRKQGADMTTVLHGFLELDKARFENEKKT